MSVLPYALALLVLIVVIETADDAPLLYPDGPLVSHTIGIPAALLAELRAEAAARRVSIATVIRERLEAGRPVSKE